MTINRWVLGLALCASSTSLRAEQPRGWNDKAFWSGAVENVLNFFNIHAWDEASGSHASEVNVAGELLNDNRDIVAIGRMVYGNAKAPAACRDLLNARRSADFIVQKMMARDEHGIYFRSVVNARGESPEGLRPYTFIFEQAYPITGLVALYSVDPEANADLLPIIREAANSFWKRFSDSERGGLFYYYNFARQDHSNDQGQIHKSYQATIYPVSSFLLSLRKADPENAAKYDEWIRSLLDVALKHVVQWSFGKPTGWLVERMSADFVPDESYLMTEAGHITQLAWVLGLCAYNGVAKDTRAQEHYLETSAELLTKFLGRETISPIGTVYDAFNRQTGAAWSENGTPPTTAWWSNLEAVIAFSFAHKHHLLGFNRRAEVGRVLNGLSQAYARYFVDNEQGGEYFRINALTGELADGTKGGPGKSGYHITETYQYLFEGEGWGNP